MSKYIVRSRVVVTTTFELEAPDATAAMNMVQMRDKVGEHYSQGEWTAELKKPEMTDDQIVAALAGRTITLPALTFGHAEQTEADEDFVAAVESGRLSLNPSAPNYVDEHMWMGRDDKGRARFKNRTTRNYLA